MKTVMIIDDEEDARKLLRYYIGQHTELSLIGEATNGVEAVKAINELKPDTVFLDIQMPGLNGFEVLTRLDIIPEIVFSTAYDQYAIKAFEVHALDYLLKPYGKKRFEESLSRIVKNQEGLMGLTETLLESEKTFPNRIILHKGKRKILINTDEIVMGEAYGDYTKVMSATDTFLSMKGISELIQGLNPDAFIRLHRSWFANKHSIVELKKKGRYFYAVLTTGHELKISESYLAEVKKIIF